MITYEDFQKLDIRIGKVLEAEKIVGSSKLIKIIFDFGSERRQIVAGMAEFVKNIEDLVGKEMPVLTNIAPRKIMGYESQGMILAADSGEEAVFLFPEKEVPPGSNIG